MGLPPYAAEAFLQSNADVTKPQNLVERVGSVFGLGSAAARRQRAAPEMIYSRAWFEAGEVDRLRSAFGEKAIDVVPTAEVSGSPAGTVQQRIGTEQLFDLVKGMPGYEEAWTMGLWSLLSIPRSESVKGPVALTTP